MVKILGKIGHLTEYGMAKFKRMEDRIVDLERQLTEARKPCTCDDPGEGRCPRHGRECDLQNEFIPLRNEAARLREALENYGRHRRDCKVVTNYQGMTPHACTCGFEKTLADSGGEEGK